MGKKLALRVGTICAVAVTALSLGAATPASATVTGPLRHNLSGKCLDASGGSPVKLMTCNGSGAQNWEIPGNTHIRNVEKNLCLDVFRNIPPYDGLHVNLQPCNGSEGQIFRWSGLSPTFISPWASSNSGSHPRVLSTENEIVQDNTPVVVWTSRGKNYEHWQLP